MKSKPLGSFVKKSPLKSTHQSPVKDPPAVEEDEEAALPKEEIEEKLVM